MVYIVAEEEIPSLECDDGDYSSLHFVGNNKMRNESKDFFAKIFYNILKKYTPKLSNGYFLQTLKGNTTLLGNDWRTFFEEREQAFHDTLKDENRYTSVADYIGKEEIDHIRQLVISEKPTLADNFVISNNVKLFSDLLDLSETEILIFQFFAYSQYIDYNDRNVFEAALLLESDLCESLALMLNIDTRNVYDAMNKGFLLKSGLLVPFTQYAGLKCFFQLSDKLTELFKDPHLDNDKIEKMLFPSNLSTELTLDNYHQAEDIGILTDIINKAVATKQIGINGFLWGLPGTGKTELAILLAKINGWKLKIIGDIDETRDEEQGRKERITSLKVALKLYKNSSEPVVLLFDEMEDLFKVDMNANFSKAFINRIIEKTPIPIIWTTNDLLCMGQAVLRRMTYSVEFGIPPKKFRRKVWDTYIQKYKLDVSDEVADHLAQTYDVVPALISNSTKVAHMSNLNEFEIQKVVGSLDTTMNFGVKRKFAPLKKVSDRIYDVSLVNASVDLVELTEQLKSAEPNFSLCLYGPPGTGKSEYGQYLARILGLKCNKKRTSDLVSMWVGETEKNIAKAFAEAKADENLLIIDEADSFLRSRAGARNSWEVTQVNEMLTQMEVHTHPFVCTTNLMDNLDEATLRRFTFKVKFDFLKPEQAQKMFKLYFNLDAPKRILQNDILTPGDFNNVKKMVTILKVDNAEKIYSMLEKECEVKPQFEKTKIGF